MREIHYTFVLRLEREDEEFEGELEDRLDHVLETVNYIEARGAGEAYSLDLYRKVVSS